MIAEYIKIAGIIVGMSGSIFFLVDLIKILRK